MNSKTYCTGFSDASRALEENEDGIRMVPDSTTVAFCMSFCKKSLSSMAGNDVLFVVIKEILIEVGLFISSKDSVRNKYGEPYLLDI